MDGKGFYMKVVIMSKTNIIRIEATPNQNGNIIGFIPCVESIVFTKLFGENLPALSQC